MLIYPAIDLYEGQAVRLYKGDYAQKTVYGPDPLSVAWDFRTAGAKQIHMVDLEGARSGATPNFACIVQICRETGLFCQVGGGIRSLDTVERYVNAGIGRVILGTAAVTRPGFVEEAVRAFPGKVAVGIDLKDGMVAIHGWTEKTNLPGLDFCRRMEDAGVDTMICTDISKDGAMKGTNRALYRELAQKCRMNLIASGGVSSMEDIRALRALGIYGAIVGKAYYTGAIALSEAIEAAL